MISLLPPNERKELNAARSNTLLLRYMFLVIALICFLVIELAVVYAFLKAEQAKQDAAVTENEQKAREYAPVKAEAAAFSTNLKVASSIMQKQVPYAAILKELSNTIPRDTIVDRIELSTATIGVPTAFNIKAKSQDSVLAFKDAFNNSKYFNDAKIISIEKKTDNKDEKYPFSASVSVVFKKELLALEDIK